MDGPPEGIQVERTGTELRITRRWRTGAGCDAVIALFVGLGLAAFGIAGGIGTRELDCIVFLPLTIGGLFLVYRGLARFLNTGEITVNSRELTIKNGPLPYWGNQNQTYSSAIFTGYMSNE